MGLRPFTIELRDYYIDELFNLMEPMPKWANEKINQHLIFSEGFENNTERWQFSIFPEKTEHDIMGEISFSNEFNSITAKISAGKIYENSSYCWQIGFDNLDFPVGGMLKLTSRIRTRDVKTVGFNGVDSISILSKDGNTNELSGAGSDILPPNFETYNSNILVGYYPRDVQYIAINLCMDNNATGTIEFDDIELYYID